MRVSLVCVVPRCQPPPMPLLLSSSCLFFYLSYSFFMFCFVSVTCLFIFPDGVYLLPILSLFIVFIIWFLSFLFFFWLRACCKNQSPSLFSFIFWQLLFYFLFLREINTRRVFFKLKVREKTNKSMPRTCVKLTEHTHTLPKILIFSPLLPLKNSRTIFDICCLFSSWIRFFLVS